MIWHIFNNDPLPRFSENIEERNHLQKEIMKSDKDLKKMYQKRENQKNIQDLAKSQALPKRPKRLEEKLKNVQSRTNTGLAHKEQEKRLAHQEESSKIERITSTTVLK